MDLLDLAVGPILTCCDYQSRGKITFEWPLLHYELMTSSFYVLVYYLLDIVFNRSTKLFTFHLECDRIHSKRQTNLVSSKVIQV